MTLRVLNMMGERAADYAHEAVPDCEVIEVSWDESQLLPDLTGDVLFAAWHHHPLFKRLDETGVRWMHLSGTGIDSWPRQLLEGRTVTCSRGLSAIPIAEFVLAEMLAFEKHIPDVWLSEPPDHWNIADLGELAGKTCGLVGLGGIGTAIAERALAFDMRVQAVRRNPSRGAMSGVEIVMDLDALLANAHHLVLAAPGTAATRNLIDDVALHKVRPGVHIVNIARGSLIDQDALRAALDDGRVAMASLDTVDPEPLPADHWMYSHPKVRVSAHVSWSSPVFAERSFRMFADNLRRFAAGEPLEGVIDIDEGY